MDGRSKRKIDIPLRHCMVCRKEIPRNTRSGQKRIPTTRYRITNFCGKKCKGVAHSSNMRGKNNPGWKGGISSQNAIIRGSYEYKLWREAVFKRDNWTCIWCNARGGELNADHIKPFALYPELRFAIDNGRTLCVECHKTTNTYKIKINKKYDGME